MLTASSTGQASRNRCPRLAVKCGKIQNVGGATDTADTADTADTTSV